MEFYSPGWKAPAFRLSQSKQRRRQPQGHMSFGFGNFPKVERSDLTRHQEPFAVMTELE